MLAHLGNANIATVAQNKRRIVANCNVFGVLGLKYATIACFSVLPTRTMQKNWIKKEKNCFIGWQIIKKHTFPASDRSKTFKNTFYARFYF